MNHLALAMFERIRSFYEDFLFGLGCASYVVSIKIRKTHRQKTGWNDRCTINTNSVRIYSNIESYEERGLISYVKF